MNRKLIFLTSLVVLLSCFSAANAGFEIKVDIAVSDDGPVDYTDKSQQPGYEDWIAWVRWGTDKETHDATSYESLGGTGLNVGMGIGDGSSNPGTILDYTTDADDPICNTWLKAGSPEPGHEDVNCHLVLYGPGLAPGTYSVYGYHNSVGGSEPTMPRVHVQTYSGALYDDILMQNVGAPNDPDGGGVTQIHDEATNDVDIAVMHVGDDALLEANRSVVKFYTDGSPVIITYEAAPGSTGILNAFIIYVPSPKTAYSPFPVFEEGYACPDTTLTWAEGEDANKHNLYLDPNLTEEVPIFYDDFEDGDANWVHPNWTIYDSNVLHDGNSDGNSGSFSHSFTPGSGLGTLTSVDIDTNDANSIRVELSIKHTSGIEAGDINLYYFNGSDWDYIADLNSVGPNDVWTTYTDDVNEDEYFITNFKLKLESDISAGELFIDDVRVTNTWPIGDEWFVGTFDTNSYTPPGNLDFDTTYYWRVDEANDAGSPGLWQGFVWHFTTETGKARDPSPGDSQGSLPLTGVSISWTPSCLANFQDVYFGTDFNDVNTASDPLSGVGVGRYPDTVTTLGLPTLTYATRYYWRVDEDGDAGLIKGDVWRFQTTGYPLMHYEFDGVLDANVYDPFDANVLTDSTGNVTFYLSGNGELRYGEPNPLWNTAGTSARFDPNGTGNAYGGAAKLLLRSCFGADLLDLDGPGYTIEAWVRQDASANYAENFPRDDDMEGTIIRKETLTYGLGIDDDGTVKFMHNGNVIASQRGRITRGEWYHIAAVYDSSDPCRTEKLYVDGLVAADNNSPEPNPQDDYSTDHVGIGAYRRQTTTSSYLQNHFNGAIDELRVIDIALGPSEFLIRGDRGLAWLPQPGNGQTNIASHANLIWRPGDLASSHNVYLGTDWDDVNDADTTTAGVYQDNVGPNTFDPVFLAMKTTWYWRVDEVDDSNNYVWKGHVWRFKTADFLALDDFESYHPTDNRIYYTWYDQRSQEPEATGAWVTLARVPQKPVHGGKQAMEYAYDTDDPWADPGYYYAEAWLPLEEIGGLQDWTVDNLKLLSLFFYGDAENDADATEQMYVGLDDTTGKYAEMRYGDHPGESWSDLKVEEWQEWNIILSYFTDSNAAVPNDVNFASIANVYIGFGNRRNPVAGGGGVVYFDDLRVSLSKCVPEVLKPAYDFSNNCIVDIADVVIMGGDWLRHDVNFADHLGIQVQKPPDANLVGHWKLDEGTDTFAEDSSDYDNHGTLETLDVNVSWVAGHDGNAVDVNGGRVRVPDAPELRPMHEVSVSVWIKYSDEQDNARVVTKGSADSNETYQLEVDNSDVLAFYIRDGNDDDPCGHVNYKAQSDIVLRRDEWAHVAGTFDANTIKCYINGELVAESDDANIPAIPYLCQDTNDLGIGNRPDANELEFNKEAFKGTIDDVRIYDYGLSQAEVAWIATDGTGYVPLTSPYNIYSGESPKVVNMKDYAELMDYWLEEKLWPPE